MLKQAKRYLIWGIWASLVAVVGLTTFNCGDEESNMGDSGPTQLTHTTAADYSPMFSPDGRYIVFVSERDGNPEIYIMDADGSGQTRLTDNAFQDETPVFSPDGRKIVFGSEGYAEGSGTVRLIRAMNTDGSNGMVLTDGDDGNNYDPIYSPDGHKIAFVSHRDQEDEIYIMNPNGSGQTRLTFNGGNDHIFSPDGTRIAYCASGEVYVMNADGSDQTQLTYSEGTDGEPSFSPDGKEIAFISYRDGTGQKIYIMSADGSNQMPLTADSGNNPTFSPTVNRFAFEAFPVNDVEINIMNSDGSGRTRFPHSGFQDRLGAFSPDGRKVVFVSSRYPGNPDIYFWEVE